MTDIRQLFQFGPRLYPRKNEGISPAPKPQTKPQTPKATKLALPPHKDAFQCFQCNKTFCRTQPRTLLLQKPKEILQCFMSAGLLANKNLQKLRIAVSDKQR